MGSKERSGFYRPALSSAKRLATAYSSMVKQERRAVDQGPGDILGGGEAPGGGLPDADLQIAPQGDKHRVGPDRPLGEFELVAQLLELGINCQRCLAGVHGIDLVPQLREWARRNKNSKYIPEALLEAWGFEIESTL